jgi:hypothetical protein
MTTAPTLAYRDAEGPSRPRDASIALTLRWFLAPTYTLVQAIMQNRTGCVGLAIGRSRGAFDDVTAHPRSNARGDPRGREPRPSTGTGGYRAYKRVTR